MCNKEPDDPWPEQAYIHEDDDMLDQLPGDGTHPSYFGDYEPKQTDEYEQPVPYDRVVSLDKTKYTEAEAQMRFNTICVLSGCRPTEPGFYTARFWCWRVTNAE